MIKTTTVPIIHPTWLIRMADTAIKIIGNKPPRWEYEQGFLAHVLMKTGQVLGIPAYINFACNWVDQFITKDGEILTYRYDDFNLDYINPAKVLLAVYKLNPDVRYLHALQLLRKQLESQPRTPSGGYWHKRIYPHQMWLDGIYMAEPFTAEYATVFNLPHLYDEVTRQIMLIDEKTLDVHSGLNYHAWDESRQQKWSDPQTGCSPHFWGRAMGWFAMALVDVLDCLPTNHSGYPQMVKIVNRLAEAIVSKQDKKSSLWYQVLDLPEREGNYLETSASAMFVYALAKAVRMNLLGKQYLKNACMGFSGLLERMVKVNKDDSVSLTGICSVAGLGGNPYRDGSFAYYMSEKVVDNDLKGISPFILAALEMACLRGHPETGDEKPCLQ